MPQSKRNRIIPTSRTTKKTPEHKKAILASVQSAASSHPYIYVFSVADMRNNFIKDLRNTLSSSSRVMMGKTRIMAIALGTTPGSACEPGVEGLSSYLKGEVGLLFSEQDEMNIRQVLEESRRPDYARSGNVAPRQFVLPRGQELYTQYGVDGGADDPIPMAQEPMLRKLGVPTKIVRGKVFLEETAAGIDDDEGYVVCREGEVLDSRQTTLLKIFGVRMAEFRVRLLAVWEKASGQVRELDALEPGEAGMEVDA